MYEPIMLAKCRCCNKLFAAHKSIINTELLFYHTCGLVKGVEVYGVGDVIAMADLNFGEEQELVDFGVWINSSKDPGVIRVGIQLS